MPVPAGIANDQDFYAQISDQVLPNIGFLRKHFFREGRLTEQQIFFILEKVMEIFKEEPNVLRLQAPITSESLCSLEPPRLPDSYTD